MAEKVVASLAGTVREGGWTGQGHGAHGDNPAKLG